MRDASDNEPTFETWWASVRLAVLAQLRRRLRSQEDVDDVFQNVALIAYRAWPRLSREFTLPRFCGWVLMTTRHEAYDFMRDQYAEPPIPIDGLPPGDEPEAPEEPEPPSSPLGLEKIVLAAADAGVLNQDQLRVVLARLRAPDATWQELAPELGLSAAHCATTYFRAVRDLRVFLFRSYPAVLGGRGAIEAAFKAALNDPVEPLTDDQAAAFRALVLGENPGYSKRGWKSALETACILVLGKLPFPDIF